MESLFEEETFTWASANSKVENKKIGAYEHLATRVDPKKVELLVAESAAK